MNKMRYLRIAVALAVLVAVFVCTFAHVPIGTLCALCPVGFAELTVASGSVPWGLLPGVLVVLAVVFLLGRVFCSWVCPTSLLKNIFGGRTPRGLTGRTGTCPGCSKNADSSKPDVILSEGPSSDPYVISTEVTEAPTPTSSRPEAHSAAVERSRGGRPTASRTSNNLAAQAIVLTVLLVVSFIVHFPVFCLFCPIGLTFGTLFAVSRLFVTWQPGWELILFPAMLFAELFLLRRWCSAICPLGFFFGLMAKARARFKFLPGIRVNKGTCLHNSGCDVCATVCPEDLTAPTADGHAMEDCTLRLDCREHCPAKAINLSSEK